jgi:acyl dehydratase
MANAVRAIDGLEELRAIVGTHLGVSDWMLVDQARIDDFADATLDHQWIHVDTERAARELPCGATIAHGFLTLSLLPAMRSQVFDVAGVSSRLNYGLGKVRFPAPVPSGSRIRATFDLTGVDDREEGRVLVTILATVEVENGDKPACVAEMLAMLIP